MLEVYSRVDRSIAEVKRVGDCLFFSSAKYSYRIEPKTEQIIRITMTGRDNFVEIEKPGVVYKSTFSDWSFWENETEFGMELPKLKLVVDKKTGAFTYLDAKNQVLLRERKNESKCLEEFNTYVLAENAKVEKEIIQTADGAKEVIKAAERMEADRLYHTWLHLDLDEKEALYGLGQQEEGILNLRGQTVYVHQANRKIALPFLVSSKHYGILMDSYSPLIWNDTCYGTYLYTQADWELDYYFVAGATMHELIAHYRLLTGKASMLPKWAYGYIQSQERYETQNEILEVAKAYTEKNLGLDGIVLDWCSWPDGLWGQKEFDKSRFENPKQMMDELHEMQVHFMISIWPNMSENCSNYQAFLEANQLLPAGNIYNAFSEEGRNLYWEQVREAFFQYGVDSFWCDSSEPYTPEWNHLRRQEPHAMFTEYCNEVGNHIPAWLTNAFSLYHAKSIYEGQRKTKIDGQKEKRVFNLTRSAYTGQQRYGTVMWSGDTGASWDTLRKQIRNGLSFCASGIPYWTADVGAFFVKTGEPWYWDGEYPATTEDKGYQELYVRWYQWCCFLPLFRGHGTDCRREVWEIAKPQSAFYQALEKMNHLRYRLLPYIYSLAGNVWLDNKSLMTPLCFTYEEDEVACQVEDSYLFGEDLLVCPVTEPMYYDKNSKPIEKTQRTRRVYLPKGNGWYDFWTDVFYEGGQWIEVDAPLDTIPVFVKEGAILSMADFTGSVEGNDEIDLKIYGGSNGCLMLYEDEGDGYGYETGEYSLRKIEWDDKKKECTTTVLHQTDNTQYCKNIRKTIIVSA